MNKQVDKSSVQSPLALANEVVQWYWEHGVKRKGSHAVSPSWLRTVCAARDVLSTLAERTSDSRASVGLWGPSQSGKSTLISQFVDAGADLGGRGGYLHWDTPTLFSSRADLPDNVVAFNPHNVGADASGCISRFTLREDSEVLFQDAPTEIHWLNSRQIMHAISAGYLSECLCDRDWNAERIEQMLGGQNAGANRTINRPAFEFLHEVLDVLDLLVEANDERFGKLNMNDLWRGLTQRIVDSPLISDQQKVIQFAAELLWGSEPILTELYERLVKARSGLPTGRIFCSMEVAAILVNIESYRIFLNNSGPNAVKGAVRIRQCIQNLRLEQRGAHSVIVVANSGNKLLKDDNDFGLLQGLVRELVIPLRASRAKSRGPETENFHKFLKQAELVDFPGVPKRDKNAVPTQLDIAELQDAQDPRLLTEVLKRGKVASLVNGYSRTLGLDAFLVLARAGEFVPKVEQLHRGLDAWWKFVDPTYDVYKPQGRRSPLPLFFNMTFFANIIDKIAEGAVSTGLHPLNEMVRQLEPFVDPNVCTLLTTTYPQFREGKIHASVANTRTAVASIISDPSFGPRCAGAVTQKSLDEMISKPDGGVSYLFEVLCSSLSPGDRSRLLAVRKQTALATLAAQLEELTPRQGNQQALKDVETFKKAIQRTLKEKLDSKQVPDPAAWVSYRLRKLLDVQPECLDPLPDSNPGIGEFEEYLQMQVKHWTESKLAYSGLSDLGIRDLGLRARILELMAQRLNVRETAKWLRGYLPKISREDALELRRTLALVMQDKMAPVGRGGAEMHPSLDGNSGVVARIRKWSEIEDNTDVEADIRQSPHFTSVIVPFAKLLDMLATGTQQERPAQPGDDEASGLLESLKSI